MTSLCRERFGGAFMQSCFVHSVQQGLAAVTLVAPIACAGAGLVYRAMGFPPQFFTVLFAVPRVTGYLAHWRESLTDPDVKIARPQQIYLVRWPCCLLSPDVWCAACSVHVLGRPEGA